MSARTAVFSACRTRTCSLPPGGSELVFSDSQDEPAGDLAAPSSSISGMFGKTRAAKISLWLRDESWGGGGGHSLNTLANGRPSGTTDKDEFITACSLFSANRDARPSPNTAAGRRA